MGFIIVNVYTAELVMSIEPRIKEELLLAKKQHQKLYYTDLGELVRECRRTARSHGLEPSG